MRGAGRPSSPRATGPTGPDKALRCAPLAAWTRAWIAGRASLDEVVDAVSGDDAPHTVTGLPETTGPVRLHDALVAWRRSGEPVHVVLPVPGDVRGLPGPGPLRTAALDAGEVAVGGALALVPSVASFAPSSAPDSVVWQAFAADPVPPDPLDLRDAQYDLTTVIRESAGALAAASVGGASREVLGLLTDARRAGDRLLLPPGHPGPAVALLAQAERLAAVLELASLDPHGGAVDRAGVGARTAALRPLATAVRRARQAGWNADPD